jgi:ribonuclease Z
MSISYHVLGKPGRDNALFVKINSGKRFYRLLFDCGENIFSNIDQSDIKQIDYIFFSHFHIDHIAGFDYLFRRIFDRERPLFLFGPAGITQIIHNRLNGYTWNLGTGSTGEWIIHEYDKSNIKISSIKASENFSRITLLETKSFSEDILTTSDFDVSTFFLNHRIDSAAYLIREKELFNIDKHNLDKLGITPGEWLQKVKDETSDPDEIIYTGGRSYSVLYLKELLLRKKEGDSLAYMTDFISDENSFNAVNKIKHVNTLVCEAQYMDDDHKLAAQNYHVTSRQAASIAKNASAEKLILFHISDRYRGDEFLSLLEEARDIFPDSYYPAEWKF